VAAGGQRSRLPQANIAQHAGNGDLRLQQPRVGQRARGAARLQRRKCALLLAPAAGDPAFIDLIGSFAPLVDDGNGLFTEPGGER